jgi:hypothetical protein
MALTSMPQHIMLWSLADIVANIAPTSSPTYHSTSYRSHLAAIETRLENMLNGTQVAAPQRLDLTQPGNRDAACLELYRLTSLIYLERASRNFSGRSAKLDQWTSAGMDVVRSLGWCTQALPLFILALEAHDDAQRIVILDCFEETRQKSIRMGLDPVAEMVRRAWALDDLALFESGSEVSYLGKMDAVIGAQAAMPSFA